MNITASHPRPAIGAVLAVYLAALLQGLTLVSFPVSSTVLRELYGFTDAQYGAIFLPQVTLAVLGAVAGGALAGRVSLKLLLIVALAANALSQLALASLPGVPLPWAFAIVMLGTAAMGFGFGLSGAPLNSYPPLLFPSRGNSALVALHTLVGVGLAGGPLLASSLASHGSWTLFPWLLLVLCAMLMGMVYITPLPEQGERHDEASTPALDSKPISTPAFWVLASIAVLYAFAEGTFSNWIVVYLQEVKQVTQASAAMALSAFWGALVVGRLTVSALVARVPVERLWLTLPPMMIGSFLLLPFADTAMRGIALFALAGLSCSAFFPLTIALATRRFPRHVAWVSSMMIAALMIGVGLGSFLIGALRVMLPLENLYRVSALYPLIALLLAGGLLLTQRKLAGPILNH